MTNPDVSKSLTRSVVVAFIGLGWRVLYHPWGKSMTRLGLLAFVGLFVGWLALSPVHAQGLLDDPLHGYCSGSGQCVDNGTNSPTSNNPAIDFGFTVSPGPNTGDLLIDFLVPDNEDASPKTLSFALTGTLTGTASLVSTTPWTSQSKTLATYLSLANASPDNKLGAYLPSTQVYDPTATGYYVYQANLGNTTLQGPSNPNVNPLETVATAMAEGSYIVGFLSQTTVGKHSTTDSWIATANSGAIFLDRPPTKTRAPEPMSLALFASGLLGLGIVRRRAGRR